VETLYKIADIFFFGFHISLILFNLFGWLFKSLRKWNLITLGLTAFSWIVLGAFYGFGYCFLTDWHWQIRDELGYPNPYNSYIHFLIDSILPVTISERLVIFSHSNTIFCSFCSEHFYQSKGLQKITSVRSFRLRKRRIARLNC
jgi:hypothetical protein